MNVQEGSQRSHPRIHLLLCLAECRLDGWLKHLPGFRLTQAVCSLGSMHMSWYTSLSRVAVRLRISLCLIEGNPPLAHNKACSTENLLPQVYTDGISDGIQPYLRAKASWKAPL